MIKERNERERGSCEGERETREVEESEPNRGLSWRCVGADL